MKFITGVPAQRLEESAESEGKALGRMAFQMRIAEGRKECRKDGL